MRGRHRLREPSEAACKEGKRLVPEVKCCRVPGKFAVPLLPGRVGREALHLALQCFFWLWLQLLLVRVRLQAAKLGAKAFLQRFQV